MQPLPRVREESLALRRRAPARQAVVQAHFHGRRLLRLRGLRLLVAPPRELHGDLGGLSLELHDARVAGRYVVGDGVEAERTGKGRRHDKDSSLQPCSRIRTGRDAQSETQREEILIVYMYLKATCC